MSRSYNYERIANDFNLWQEFVDVSGLWSEKQFNEADEQEKIALIADCFGEDEEEDSDVA
jgi:hypothetical protein